MAKVFSANMIFGSGHAVTVKMKEVEGNH